MQISYDTRSKSAYQKSRDYSKPLAAQPTTPCPRDSNARSSTCEYDSSGLPQKNHCMGDSQTPLQAPPPTPQPKKYHTRYTHIYNTNRLPLKWSRSTLIMLAPKNKTQRIQKGRVHTPSHFLPPALPLPRPRPLPRPAPKTPVSSSGSAICATFFAFSFALNSSSAAWLLLFSSFSALHSMQT